MKLRGNYLFQPLDVPTPLQQPTRFEVNWKNYVSQNGSTKSAHPPVIYVVSPVQRSGTNYLNYLVNLHQELEFPDKNGFPKEQFLYSYSSEIREYAQKTIASWGKWVESEEELNVHVKQMMGHMGTGLLNYLYSNISPDKTLLLKTPDSGGLNDFFHLFPNGKVAIIVRDGRDTVESFVQSWGGDGIFTKMTQRWATRVEQMLAFREEADQNGLSDRHYMIRYDLLNQHQKTEMEKLLDHFQLDKNKYDWDGMEKAPVLGSSTLRGTQEQVNWDPQQKPGDFNQEAKWASWTARKKQIFKQYAGEALIKLGFEKDNNW
ncbi:MAG: sulfotransferase [Bacteroidota bacterium]